MTSSRITGKGFSALLLVLCATFMPQLAPFAGACPTCGCSELCAITMLDDSLSNKDAAPLLSNSIWGNLILKLAYKRDPQLQKLARIKQKIGLGSMSALSASAAGTLAQTTVSIAALNPPTGVADSYVPGTIGLALEGVTNAALWTRLGCNSVLRTKIATRQKTIRRQVESILEHLEYSQADCPEAQKQLAQIIGETAARECVELWHTSHAYRGSLAPELGMLP